MSEHRADSAVSLIPARVVLAAFITVCCLSSTCLSPALAAELRVRVSGSDDAGNQLPLADAVVSLHAPRVSGATASASATIDQRNSMFVPGVLPLQVGTEVVFPNSDNTLHHVYSFSPAKRFELPLYSGRRADPVLFDKTGVVTLGCNIHDWMIAHVVVLDTPYFARTGKDGIARIQAPAGEYELQIWHARQAESFERAIVLGENDARREMQLVLKPKSVVTQPGSSRLRELQQRLRQLRDKG